MDLCPTGMDFKKILSDNNSYYLLETKEKFVQRQMKKKVPVSRDVAEKKFDALMASSKIDIHDLPDCKPVGMSRLCLKKDCAVGCNWPNIYGMMGLPEHVYHGAAPKAGLNETIAHIHKPLASDDTTVGQHLRENNLEVDEDDPRKCWICFAKPNAVELARGETVAICARKLVVTEFPDKFQINKRLTATYPLTKSDFLDMRTHIGK